MQKGKRTSGAPLTVKRKESSVKLSRGLGERPGFSGSIGVPGESFDSWSMNLVYDV